MNLYPAIDLYEGKVVRLERGDFQKLTIYSEDPSAFAKKWEAEGARWIHVVDLEGAKTSVQKNLEHVLKIRETVKCRIQCGGGFRTLDAIENVLAEGINRVVVGTKALDLAFLERALAKFGDRLVIGLDTKNGVVQTQGWLDGQNPTIEETLKQLNDFPVETLIFTDIQKDGMMQGPNFPELEKVLNSAKANVILSGGVSRIEDLQKCHELTQPNFDGAIIGKALYEGKINLRDALKL